MTWVSGVTAGPVVGVVERCERLSDVLYRGAPLTESAESLTRGIDGYWHHAGRVSIVPVVMTAFEKSTRAAKELVRSGAVAVNGTTIRDVDEWLDPTHTYVVRCGRQASLVSIEEE